MSKGLAGVKTLTAKQIADKWKLPLAVVAKKIAAGVKVEKEHTTSLRQANEIARDHLGERPDYYDKLDKMEKTKIVKEESTTSGVAGLGFVTGTPAVGVNDYINTNAMSYYDENGNRLDNFVKAHTHLHNSHIGYNAFDPKKIGAHKNFHHHHIYEAKLNELGEYDNKGGMSGYEPTSAPIRAVRRRDVKEQSPANISYKERPMYEKSTGNNPMPTGVERGIYQEAIYQEATYQGKKVALNKPMKGDVKKSKVYVDPDGDGKAQKVNFGDKKLSIKKDQPNRKKSYCARSGGISGKKDVTSANYWSRKAWNCNEASAEKLSSYTTAAAERLASGSDASDRQKEVNRITGINTAVRKLHPEIYPGEVKVPVNEMDTSNMPSSDNIIDRRPSIRDNIINSVKTVAKAAVAGPASAIGRAIKNYNDKSNDVTGSVTTVNELSNETLGSYVTGAQKQIDKTTARMNKDPGSISPADDRLIQQRTSGIGLATSKMGLNEISAELVGKVSNARFFRGEAPSKTLNRAVIKKFIESGKKKEEPKKDVKEYWTPFLAPHHKHSARLSKEKANKPDTIMDPGAGGTTKTTYEETKMDNKELINEALDCILEDNLPEMKDNLMKALQEKAMEKLEERKKEIAANYFAQ